MHRATSMFRNREEAGRELASRLDAYAHSPATLVLGLPRGGVPVAYELAEALDVEMDIFLVRKLGVPWEPELAMGAVASGDVRVINPEVVQSLGIPEEEIEAVARREREVLLERERLFRGDSPPAKIEGRNVILVDDGLATGSSMRAAITALRLQLPAKIVAAVPVGAPQTCERLRQEVDEMICAVMPDSFFAVGQWYVDFSPVTDDEVRDLLQRFRQRNARQTL